MKARPSLLDRLRDLAFTSNTMQVKSLEGIGDCYLSLGQPQKALEYFQQALPLIQKGGAEFYATQTLQQISLAHRLLGQSEKEREVLEQTLVSGRRTGNKAVELNALHRLGTIHHDTRQFEEALKWLAQAVEIADEYADGRTRADLSQSIALCQAALGRTREAIENQLSCVRSWSVGVARWVDLQTPNNQS
jgi:tetratricopeptide (TPR) repeat protein